MGSGEHSRLNRWPELDRNKQNRTVLGSRSVKRQSNVCLPVGFLLVPIKTSSTQRCHHEVTSKTPTSDEMVSQSDEARFCVKLALRFWRGTRATHFNAIGRVT